MPVPSTVRFPFFQDFISVRHLPLNRCDQPRHILCLALIGFQWYNKRILSRWTEKTFREEQPICQKKARSVFCGKWDRTKKQKIFCRVWENRQTYKTRSKHARKSRTISAKTFRMKILPMRWKRSKPGSVIRRMPRPLRWSNWRMTMLKMLPAETDGAGRIIGAFCFMSHLV